MTGVAKKRVGAKETCMYNFLPGGAVAQVFCGIFPSGFNVPRASVIATTICWVFPGAFAFIVLCLFASPLFCFFASSLLCFSTVVPLCFPASPLFCFSLRLCFSNFSASLLSAFPGFSLLTCLSASLRTSFSVFRVFPLFLFPALQIILADPTPTEETLKQLKIKHSQKNVGLILNNPYATLGRS